MGTEISTDALRRARESFYLSLYSRCFDRLLKAKQEFLLRQYGECVFSLYECSEFLWKALRQMLSHDVPTLRQHMPTRRTWDTLTVRLGTFLTPQELHVLTTFFQDYNPGWEPNPQKRLEAYYGTTLQGEADAAEMIDRAEAVGAILARTQRRLNLAQENLNIGLLNGYLMQSIAREKPCTEARWADYEGAGIEGWKAALLGKGASKLLIHEIPVGGISNAYVLVINPFGEAHPELLSTANVLPGYQRIKSYIYSGGVFVTAGGHPFTYLFDVMTGKMENASTFVPNVPVSVRLTAKGDGKIDVSVTDTTVLVDNLLEQDFSVETTWDDPAKQQAGPYICQVFQSREDRRFWDSDLSGQRIDEFRSFVPSVTGSPVAVLRAHRLGNEVYPVAFVRHGFGSLLHIGLALTQGKAKEFDVAVSAVTEGLLKNFDTYFVD